jgi:hypothetical protein
MPVRVGKLDAHISGMARPPLSAPFWMDWRKASAAAAIS